MENNHKCYFPGKITFDSRIFDKFCLVIEDITDEENDEEEVVLLDILSYFPKGECSRTSPGNHSTVRCRRQ